MKLKGIISISGKPGLSKIISQSKNGIIVESLIDGKRFPVQGAQRVSSVEDISIYTYEEDVPLTEVFQSIYDKEGGKSCISHKSEKADLKNYILEILPNIDEERVYVSDMKKMVQWYNLLQEKGLLEPEQEEPKEKEEVKEEKEKPKAKKKTAKKKESKEK